MLVLACSHGGHLELLESLEPAYGSHPRAWVTAASEQAHGLLARGERVVLLANPGRRPGRLARNAAQAARALRALRPALVVTSGANVAVPFCLLARARGVPVVFVETMARVVRGSLSGRVLAPLARDVIVQWPELLASYPRARVCRPSLLEGIPPRPAARGRGTLAVAGSHGQPFDRLVRLVDEAAGRGALPAPVTVQALATFEPRHVEVVPRLPGAQLRTGIAEAGLVIAHGGAGLVSLALRNGRMPLVLPRRREHGEHVDDHQVTMVAALERRGLVVSLEGRAIEDAIPLAAASWPADPHAGLPGRPLVDELEGLVSEVLG